MHFSHLLQQRHRGGWGMFWDLGRPTSVATVGCESAVQVVGVVREYVSGFREPVLSKVQDHRPSLVMQWRL